MNSTTSFHWFHTQLELEGLSVDLAKDISSDLMGSLCARYPNGGYIRKTTRRGTPGHDDKNFCTDLERELSILLKKHLPKEAAQISRSITDILQEKYPSHTIYLTGIKKLKTSSIVKNFLQEQSMTRKTSLLLAEKCGTSRQTIYNHLKKMNIVNKRGMTSETEND